MESSVASSDAVYKCRKCRHPLFSEKCVVNAHGSGINLTLNDAEDQCSEVPFEENTVWFLRDDALPSWVEILVNQANWIKGKVICPKCNGKIGSFDYVNGSKCLCGRFVLPSVHVVKGKIDRENADAELVSYAPMDVAEKQDTESTKEARVQAKSAASPKVLPLLACVAVEQEPTLHDISGLDTLVFSKGTVRKPCEDVSNCLKTKRRKTFNKPNFGQNAEAEPSEELLCAICLDIYHHPFICYPCTHVFCEMCLRCLAKLDPQHTRCPLCRKFIGLCIPDSDRCQLSKSLYPKYYQMRQTALHKTRNFPLPWQTSYRPRQAALGRYTRFWLGWQSTNAEAGAAHSVWESLSTVGILITLHLIALLTFFIGYYGCHYIPVFVTWILEEPKLLFGEIDNF